MKTLLKILGISFMATIIYIIGSSLLPYSDAFNEAAQNSSPIDLVYLYFVHIWITGTIFYIAKKIRQEHILVALFIAICLCGYL